MAFFFPPEYLHTRYHDLYRSLSPVARLMLHREFVGVRYLRRFVLLKREGKENRFRREQGPAGWALHRKLSISRLTWLRTEVVRNYLKIILRHYLFGFLVQLAGRKRELDLPAPSPACYWETPVNLVVLRWLNRHRQVWQTVLERTIEELIENRVRHHYIYCLLAGRLATGLYDRDAFAAECSAVRRAALPGRIPIGLELEFSNLGRQAVDKDCPADLIAADPFRNFEYYDSFQLEDATWRLGGYVDTHVHGRRLFSLTRYGGFFEYSLVRVDYPRTYTLPLTTDPALAADMVCESVDFIPEIKPHSLHVNLEYRGTGDQCPKLDDYLCLLLLGGDFVRNREGRLRESRLADREFTRFIKLRRHLCLLTESKKRVVEFAFLRLWERGRRGSGYLPLLLALKGFLSSYRLRQESCSHLPQLLAWARAPRPLPGESLVRFVDNVISGLRREGCYRESRLADFRRELNRIFRERQSLLSSGMVADG